MLVVLAQVLSRDMELGPVVRHDRIVGEEAEEVRRVLVLPRLAVGLGEAVQLVVVGCVGAFDGAGRGWDSEIHGVGWIDWRPCCVLQFLLPLVVVYLRSY